MPFLAPWPPGQDETLRLEPRKPSQHTVHLFSSGSSVDFKHLWFKKVFRTQEIIDRILLIILLITAFLRTQPAITHKQTSKKTGLKGVQAADLSRQCEPSLSEPRLLPQRRTLARTHDHF